MRARMPGTVSIFVLPPSRQALETRLKERGQDDEAVIRRRMQGAVAEASHYDEYDYLVVNEDFEAALGEMRCIVQAQRLRKAQQSERQQALLRELLGP